MKRNLTGGLHSAATSALYTSMMTAMSAGTLNSLAGNEDFSSADNELSLITGNEGFNKVAASVIGKSSESQRFGILSAIQTALNTESVGDSDLLKTVAGNEGFSLVQKPGDKVAAKAASITLNALAHRQTDAAEEMYKTVTVGYTDEQIDFTVQSSGIGRYVFGAGAYEKVSSLTPITSILRDGKFFMEDTLALYPVYPEQADSANRKFFVKEEAHSPWEVNYGKSDALKRTSHHTNYLQAGRTIPNLLGVSQAPGQAAFDTTDEVESNSIMVKSVLLNVSVGAKSEYVTVDTRSYSNRNFGPTINGQTSDDRRLALVARGLKPASFLKGEEVSKIFDELTVNGLVPSFSFTLTGNFNRANNTLDTQTGELAIDYITDEKGVRHLPDTKVPAIAAIFAKFKDGQVVGLDIGYNHNNINRSNFGYRVELFDAVKVFPVRRQTPISVIYPVAKEDTNEPAISKAVDEMNVILQAQTTAKAFSAAEEHIALVAATNGAAIVGNEQASNVMAGMHFVNSTYLARELKLADAVSAIDSITVLEAVEKAMTAEMNEMIAALNTKSGLAAISEYRKIDKKWTVVGHQNLIRYMMRQGDSRSAGQGVDFKLVPTNLDSMIGKFYMFPESETSGSNIDIIGGMGVMISKEHQVIQASVTRNNKDHGVIITQPAYQHHSVTPIIGVLNVLDAHEALTEKGLVRYLSSQRVKLVNADGDTYTPSSTADAGDAGADAGQLP